MKTALFQTDIIWEDHEANLAKIELQLPSFKGHLVILPEMFATGFTMSPERMAEPADRRTVQWMTASAARYGCAIMGSLPIDTGAGYVNRMVMATPDGHTVHYDKRHLFRMGGEEQHYVSGSERVIFEYNGVRILPLVCYDLRFPVWARNRGDYDMIVYVASWPSSRIYAWETLLRARAIENQCFVAGVNRIGTQPDGLAYCGGTVLIDFLGREVATAARNQEMVITGEINLESLAAFRSSFPAYLDADNFHII